MDAHLAALLGPKFEQVFGAVATVQGAQAEESVDAAIMPEAAQAVRAMLRQAEERNPDPAARLMLLAGQTGTGKTHTLTMAARAIHRDARSLACILPMVDLVDERQFDSWLLRNVIIRLSEPYLVYDEAAVPLARLAERVLGEAPPALAAQFALAIDDGATEPDAASFRLLVNSIRVALATRSRQSPVAEATIAALLGTLLVSEVAYDYLCGCPVDTVFGGIRLANDDATTLHRVRLDDLMKLVAATGGALLVAFDQLEQSKLDGWEARARHAISRGAMLAETMPNLGVVFAVLPSLYEAIAGGIDGSIRDRLERLGAQTVRLTPLTRRNAESLLARRLAVLWEHAGLAAPEDALHPFPGWFREGLGQQTARFVTEGVQEFRRIAARLGRLPEEHEFAPAETGPGDAQPRAGSDAAAPAPGGPAEDYDSIWDQAQAHYSIAPPPATGNQQAALLEWALRAVAPELAGVDTVRVWKEHRGQAQTIVIGVDFEGGGQVVERREIALCNEPSGAALSGEIGSALAGVRAGVRPVLVRGKGGRFPKGGRGAGPLLEKARERGAIVVPMVERATWERLQRAQIAFHGRTSAEFLGWQRRACPLSRTPGFAEMVAYPYEAEAAPAGPAPAPETPAVLRAAAPHQRLMPRAPAVLLGHASGTAAPIYWAPNESETRLLNFGALVTGDSGSGKTQTLRVLIDGVIGMGLPVAVFDFKNDYADRAFATEQGLRVHNVRRFGIPFNPLVPSANEDGLAQPIEHIFTICAVLKRVFGLGERQNALLRDAMKQAFVARGVDPQKWQRAEAIRAPSFNDVIAILEEAKEQRNSTAISLIDRVAPLFELGLFPSADDIATPFEEMLKERVVLSLFELPSDEIKGALAELIIIRLHGFLLRGEQPRRLTRLLVLDEAWRVAASKNLEHLAREGRAFGVGLAIGTQYPGDLPADLAGSLATKIFLKNQQQDHRRAVVKALSGSGIGASASDVQGLLDGLEMFEGLIQNQHYMPFAGFKLEPYFQRQRTPRTGTEG